MSVASYFMYHYAPWIYYPMNPQIEMKQLREYLGGKDGWFMLQMPRGDEEATFEFIVSEIAKFIAIAK